MKADLLRARNVATARQYTYASPFLLVLTPQRFDDRPSLLNTAKLIGALVKGNSKTLFLRDRDRTCIESDSKHIWPESSLFAFGKVLYSSVP